MTVPSRYPGYRAGSVGRTPPKKKEENPFATFKGGMSLLFGLACIIAFVFLQFWRFDRIKSRFNSDEEPRSSWSDRLSTREDTGIGRPRSRFDELVPEGEPAYSQDQINEWLPQMQREVEAVAGRKFKHTPPVRVISRDDLRRLLIDDDGQAAQVLDDLPGEIEMTAVSVLGIYDPDADMVYMIPGNLTSFMEASGTSRDLTNHVAQLVLAHELAHALQDQHLDLNRMQDAAENVEQSQALRATIEGHATLIEDIIADRMGLVKREREDVAPGEHNHEHLAGDDALIQSMLDYQDLLVELYYDKGSAFLHHNLQRGGQSQVWRILSHPPPNTAPFMNPARYWQPGQGTAKSDELLANLASHFDLAGAQEQRFELGAFTMRLMYRRMRPSHADSLVSNIQLAHAMTLSGTRHGEMAGVVVFELRKGADVNAFIRTLEQVAPGVMTPPDSASTYTISNPRLRKLPGIESTFSREMKFDYSDTAGRSGLGRVVRIARGNRIVEITNVGFEVDDKRVIELANEVFRRLDM